MIVVCKSRCEKGGQILDVRQPVNMRIANRLGIVSWWTSFGSGGNRFRDLMRRNHGTLNGGMSHRSPAGRRGGYGSFYFDEVNDYIRVSHNSTLSITSAITLLCWVNPASVPGGSEQHRLVSKGVDKYVLFFDPLSLVPQFYLSGVSTSQFSFTAGATIGKWSLLGASYDANGGTNNRRTYMNGKLDRQASHTGSISTDTVDLTIGAYHTGSSFMSGYMDDIVIASRPWTSREHLWWYNDSVHGHPKMLNWIEDGGHSATGNRRRRFMMACAE